MQYVTYAELFQLLLVLIGIVGLFIQSRTQNKGNTAHLNCAVLPKK